MRDLVFRLLDVQFRDMMLAYGSFRVVLEEILESNLPAFEHLKETTVDMLCVSDDKILDLISDAESQDEAHHSIEFFIEDIMAPLILVLDRYLDEQMTNDIIEDIYKTARPYLHDKVALHYNQEPVTDTPIVAN